MNLKQLLIRIVGPRLLPLTRAVLKRHYNQNKQLTSLENDQKVLVLVPHVDDETIGAGGTIKNHVNQGSEVRCALITDGSNSRSELDKSELTQIRKKEMAKVKDILGISHVHYFDFPDSKVESTPDSQEKLLQIINEFDPDLIYTTTIVDAHHDHIVTAELLADTLKQTEKDYAVRMYEINCPIPPGEINCVVDISESMEVKQKAINIFASQTIDFSGFLELNRLKRYLIKDNLPEYAEVFIESNKVEFIHKIEAIKNQNYNFSKIFKQANRTDTLLWALFKNYHLKKDIYRNASAHAAGHIEKNH
ncbi:PIG-L deacetylase family protein [Alteribacillus sp. HJP-4]|uniref:PIG-L deacetylase family protein n=1 Tax=Alteribacillus sp. HJP-4 TaxID=2775394 RepID=UPI0035CD1569